MKKKTLSGSSLFCFMFSGTIPGAVIASSDDSLAQLLVGIVLVFAWLSVGFYYMPSNDNHAAAI